MFLFPRPLPLTNRFFSCFPVLAQGHFAPLVVSPLSGLAKRWRLLFGLQWKLIPAGSTGHHQHADLPTRFGGFDFSFLAGTL